MKEPNSRVRPYQAIRLIACLCIILLHCYSARFDRAAAWGVSFFFSVSGFLYGLRCREKDLPVKETPGFLLDKLKKIYPVFLLTNLLALPFELTVKPVGQAFTELGVTLSLVQAWSPRLADMYLGSTWFISSILFLYLMTPLLVTGFKALRRRFGTAGLSAVCVLSALACVLIPVLAGKAEGDPTFRIYTFPPARLPEYALFLAAGLMIPEGQGSGQTGNGLAVDLGYLAAAGLLAVLFFLPQIPRPFSRVVLWTVPNTALLLLGLRNAGTVNRLLSGTVPVYLGGLGLSMYLFHPVIFVYTTFWNDFWDSARILRVLCFLGILALTVLCAVLTDRVKAGLRRRNAQS